LACRQASKQALYSAFVAIAWAVMSQGLWTLISHHWFTTLFSMVTAWAALASVEEPQRRQWEPLIAGVAAGAATMVTPTGGALAMIAAASSFFDSHCSRAKLIAFAVGSALLPMCLLAYVIWNGALTAAFDDVILFTATRYGSGQESVPFGYFSDDQNRPLKYLFPLVALLVFVTCIRDWRTIFRDRSFRSCFAFGLAGFIGCFPRPDMAHIAFVTPLVCPLLTYCMHRIVASWATKYRYALAALVVILCIPSVVSFSFVANTALHGELVATPRGRVVLFGDGTRELIARIAAAPPSDSYFFYPRLAMLPFLTDRDHVSKYDIFTPGYTSPFQYQEVCTAVLQRASWIVIDRNWTTPDFLRLSFPALRNAKPRETKRFELALQSGFDFVARYGPLELRHRAKMVNDAVCAEVAE
jgi:hypothetical protein